MTVWELQIRWTNDNDDHQKEQYWPIFMQDILFELNSSLRFCNRPLFLIIEVWEQNLFKKNVVWVCFGNRSENWRVLLISAADCAKRAGASQIDAQEHPSRLHCQERTLYPCPYTNTIIHTRLQHGTIQPTARSLGSRDRCPSGASSGVQKWSNLAFVQIRCKYFRIHSIYHVFIRGRWHAFLVQRLAQRYGCSLTFTTIGFTRKRECGVGFG